MKRKILSLILVFAMTVSLLTVGTGAVEPTYGDTAGHWAESSIERWSAYGIIQGSNGQFDPNGQLTCAQLATILAKLLKLPAAKDAGFTDNTADAWYYDAINRCAAAGILNGNGDGTVTPEAPITRERAMVMLARALGIEPIRKPDLTKYADAAQVSAYAQGYVAALIEAGIVGGVTADQLAPQANINRASTVTILDRAISTYADQAGATVKADGKGIVLVVAENVKITGAPEGTKIVVADGATGLTVNGKSVSDDQTYIVPKTTTGSGSSSGGYSHSHTWVDNYCNGCGQFKDTVVAAIGKKGYETLEAAIDAAQSGDTVKLLGNETVSATVAVDKNLTLDLGGNTLTGTNCRALHITSGKLELTGTGTVKSTGIAVNSSVVRVGDNNGAARNVELVIGKDVVIESPNSYGVGAFGTATTEKLTIYGTIKSTATTNESYDGCAVTTLGTDITTPATITIKEGAVISAEHTNAVYLPAGTLTVEGGTITGTTGIYFKSTNMTISGGTITGNGEAKNYEYYGNGGISTGEAVTIDSCNYPGGIGSVSIRGGEFSSTNANAIGSYNSNSGSLQTNFVTGGTFSSNPSAYVHEGYVATKSATEEIWTVGEGSNPLVAEINGVKYISLAKALAAAKNGDTVKLTQDITPDERIVVTGNKNITIDLAEKKITSKADVAIVNNGTGKLTITGNGTVENSASEAENIAIWARIGSIDIENGTFINKSNKEATVYAGTSADASTPVITIKGGTFENKATGPYEYKNSLKPLTLNVQNDKPVTSIVITGGTFYGNDPKNGDDNKGGTFLAPDYKSVETPTGSGVWTVEKKNWDDYDADGTTMPAGVKITSRDNNGNVTVTLEDEDAFKYFTQKFDMDAACSARKTALDNGATRYPGESVHNHLNIWYRAYHQVHVEMAKSVNLGGMEVTPFTEYSTFDGKGFTISNAKVSGADTSVGFFGGNPITNVKMDSISVTANDTQYAGVISGFNSSSITNVTVTRSTVTGGKNTGAIVGNCYVDLSDCTVENCTISGQYKVGGLAGYVCREDGQKRIIRNNTLRNVTLKGEKLISGKSDFVIGQAIGNWNARSGGSINVTTIENVTGADSLIGKIESDVATPSIDGKVQVGSQEALANAISSTTADEETSIKLTAGTYTLPSLESKSITISGTKDTVIDMKGADGKGVVNQAKSASFDGVTVNFGTKPYKGFQHTETLTFKDCTITGFMTTYGDTTYENCTFNSEANQYAINFYGGENFTLTNCHFYGVDKNVYIYQEGVDCDKKVTFNGCDFHMSQTDTTKNKSAIMLNAPVNYNNHKYIVVINNCTAEGVNTVGGENVAGKENYQGLYGLKHKDGNGNSKLIEGTVTVDGTVVYEHSASTP